MLPLRKFCGTCAVFAFCMLLTGFLGGEKPQDAITGIITAIDNNDVKGFNARVHATYMEAVLQSVVKADKEPMLAIAGGNRETFNTLLNKIMYSSFLVTMELGEDVGTLLGVKTNQAQKEMLKTKRTQEQWHRTTELMDILRSILETSVKDGGLGNMCRKLSMAALPFAPEMLKSAKVSEAGTGTEEGIATASIMLPNNEEVVLGLAEINKQWVVVTFGGNRKAAADLAIKYRAGLLEQAQILADRRKNADLYVKEMKASRLAIFEAAKAKDTKALSELLPNTCDKTTDIPSGIKIDSPELLELVTEQMILCMEDSAANKKTRVFDDELASRLQQNNEFDEKYLGEVVEQNSKYILTRFTLLPDHFKDLSGKSHPHEYWIQRRENWLNGVADPAITGYEYELYQRDGKRLTAKAYATDYYDVESNKAVRYATFIGPQLDGSDPQSNRAFTLTEYAHLLMKHYESLENNAKKIFANKENWTKELQATQKGIDDAIAQKNPEALTALMDLPRFLRDTGTLEQVATATLDNAQSNADIKAFQDSIKAGTATLFGGPLVGQNDIKIAELNVFLNAPNRKFLRFEREKANAPWKLVQYDENQNNLRRPENWQAQVDAEMKKIQAQRDQKVLEEKADMARLATELETARPKLAAALTALADGLDKKDPEAVFAVLDVNALALCPALPCVTANTDSLRTQVAPTAAFSRKLSQAIKDAKQLEGFEVLWDTAALRKASFSLPSIPVKGTVNAYIATVQSKDGPRFMGLGTDGKALRIVTAPEVEPAVLPGMLFTMVNEVWLAHVANFKPSDAQNQLHQLAEALRTKNGEEAAKFVDFGFTALWNSTRWDSGYEDALANMVIFPDNPAILAASKNFASKCAATGTFKLTDAVLDSDVLETASISTVENLIKLSTNSCYVLFAQDKAGQLKAITSAPAIFVGEIDEISLNYRRVQTHIKSKLPTIMRNAAVEACVNGILSTVRISDISCTLMQKGSDFILNVRAIATNTNKVPVKIDRLKIDLNVANPGPVTSEFRLPSLTLYASQPTQVEWDFSVEGDFAMVFLANAKAGLDIVIRPSSMEIGKTSYSLDRSYGIKPVDKGDGTWQLENFAPVRPKAPESFTQEVTMKALRILFAEHIKQSEAAYLDALTKLLGKVELKIIDEGGEQKLALINNLESEVLIFQIEGNLMDKGLLAKQAVANCRVTLAPGGTESARLDTEFVDMVTSAAAGKGTLEFRATQIRYKDTFFNAEEVQLLKGHVPPLMFSDDPVLATWSNINTAESSKTDTAKPEAAKPDVAKPDVAKPEAVKTEAAKPEDSSAQAAGSVTATGTPTPTANKKPGTAVRGTTAMDVVGLTAFGPDSKADSVVRVSALGTSPLVGVRIDNMGGTAASWKTKDVKTTAKGVLVVLQNGKILNPQDASFSLDVTKPVVLDILVQDNGALADGKTVLRVIFYHKDGTRSYATLEPAKQ